MPVCNFEQTDKIYAYATAHGMKIRGHAIIYDSSQWDWFFHERYDNSKPYVDAATLKTRLEHLIKTVIEHYDTNYPGITYSWDIFNEVVDVENSDDERGIRNTDKLYTILGNDYIKLVYSYARKYLNPVYDTKLFLNDWGCFTNKRPRLIALSNWMNNGNAVVSGLEGAILVDGIGMEGYYNVNAIDLINVNNTDYGIAEAVKQFNANGLEVQFTELTVANSDDTEAGRKALAKYDYDLYSMLVTLNQSQRDAGKKGITGICTWGIIDNPFLHVNDYATGLTGTHCGMLDYTFKAKPSFNAIQAALKAEAYPY
jgi:endo-1,4-beta-xylanase